MGENWGFRGLTGRHWASGGLTGEHWGLGGLTGGHWGSSASSGSVGMLGRIILEGRCRLPVIPFLREGVAGRGVTTVDMVFRAELLILPGHVFSTTVMDDGPRCSEVSHKCVCFCLFVLCFAGEELFKHTVLVYNAEAKCFTCLYNSLEPGGLK